MPRSPVVDLKTGYCQPEWLLWFQRPNYASISVNTALAVSSGGSGQAAALTDGQILIGSSVNPLALTPNTITPTSHQTTVINGSGTIKIGTAQNIDTSSSPIFNGISLNSLNVSGISSQSTISASKILVLAIDDGVSALQVAGKVNFNSTTLLLNAADDGVSVLQAVGKVNFTSTTLLLDAIDDGINKLQVNGGLSISNAAYLLTNYTSFTNNAGAHVGTLTNAPAVGNPTKWIGINDNGTTRYIPTW